MRAEKEKKEAEERMKRIVARENWNGNTLLKRQLRARA